MDIKIEIKLKDSTWGFSDLLDGRELNNQTKKEIIELLKEDIRAVFDQQIEVEQLTKQLTSTDTDKISSSDNVVNKYSLKRTNTYKSSLSILQT